MDFRLFIREVCKFPNSHYQAIEEGLDCNAFESAGRWGSIMDRIKDIPLGNEAALYASLIDLYNSISTQIGPLFDLQSKTNLAFRDTSQKYLLDSPAFRKLDITGVSGTMPNGTPSWKDVLVCWEVKHSNKRGAQDQLGEPPRKRSKPSQSTSPSRQSNSEVAGSTPGRDSDDPLEQLPLALESTRWEMPGCWIKFDMMNKRVYNNYVDLTNIVVRVSDGTPEGKRNAVLVNSHLDSTLPSPGAADDAISVRVMLECIRVLTEPPGWQPVHSIIFLFNNAEESLQDGSHLYATQHFTAHTVRAIINLEAAGSTGPELLFQATSEEMIEAYSHVLRPFGTVLANDVFSSGVIMSEYPNMAIVGNSYLYHTRRDTVENIEPGVAQNTLALLTYLSSSASPLPTLQSYSPPKTPYFSLLSRYFFSYYFSTAQRLYTATFLLSLPLFRLSRLHAQSIVGVPVLLIFGLVSANVFAALMSSMALLGVLVFQVFLNSRASGQDLERLSYCSVHLFFSAGAWAVQRAGIAVEWVWGDAKVPVASYVLGSFGPLVLGTKVATSLTDIFVPLTGRMGSLPPVNNIIALLTTVAAFYAFPLVLPLSHRFGARALKIFTLSVAGWSNAPEAVFWYITSGEYTLQLGSADAAPGFEALVNELAAEFGAPGAKPTLNVMDDWNLDRDVLYPFLQFVTSYKVAAPWPQGYESSWEKIFTVKAYNDILDFATRTRKLTLKILRPCLIWTVIAFDALVVNWSLDSPPPYGEARHHIKEALYYGTNEWLIKLEIKVPGLGAGQFTHEP
ncbi:peptidase M28 family, partial [Rhizoctonia solani]